MMPLGVQVSWAKMILPKRGGRELTALACHPNKKYQKLNNLIYINIAEWSSV
jgi:hypothetical protein